MFLIVTRNFPPDIGGIQALMGGLSESLLEHGPVKIFADEKRAEEYRKKNFGKPKVGEIGKGEGAKD